MTVATGPLEAILARHDTAAPDLEAMNADDLKRAARFWCGTTAANKMRKAECAGALKKVFQDRRRLQEGLRSLPDKQRQILSLFRRYGGALSGPLLQCEALARGLVEKTDDRRSYYGRQQPADPVLDLCAKLLLVSQHGGGYGRYDRYYFYSGYRRAYPDLVLPPGIRDLVEPAPPLSWHPSRAAQPPATMSARPAAAVALDLWSIAQALAQAGSWKTNRGGTPAKSVQNRLAKAVAGGDSSGELVPPALESLYYEILRGLGAITVEDDEGSIDLEVVRHRLQDAAIEQGWHWVRAWLSMRLWQDGIGVVPDRDRPNDPERIEPRELHTARELLTWALGRMAQTAEEWLDLETFLCDLWEATGEEALQFYWHHYSWQPDFAAARGKAKITADKPRRLAYWLDSAGTWAANALLGTLAHLGLIEHGVSTSRAQTRPCFRLTGLGQAVFGAPERAGSEPTYEPKFLTVQPNYDILAYLNVADPRAVWPLAQMARRVSAPGERVQTFALSRESVYQALESGLTPQTIRDFLTRHSKTGLPDLVAHSLTEWGRKREALIFRTGIALGVGPPGSASPFAGMAKARPVADSFVLFPPTATRGLKECLLRDHHAFTRPTWQMDEEGRVRVTDAADSVCLARLAQFADPEGKHWVITAASVGRARERGIPAEQILGWLDDHLSHELPPITKTAICNWSSPAGVFLGELVMLQVNQPQAYEMVRDSPRFQPLLLGAFPPNWFVVRPEKRSELERRLTELGFAVGASWKPSAIVERSKTGDGSPRDNPKRKHRKRRRSEG
ncbi:MAG TPA: helicase-associated domain-containing protein [Gemmataceae bacterium]|nr:helicase-associated domain-containing protein [Gemmataceae bacterium]